MTVKQQLVGSAGVVHVVSNGGLLRAGERPDVSVLRADSRLVPGSFLDDDAGKTQNRIVASESSVPLSKSCQ